MLQPNQGSIAGAQFSNKQQKSSYQNYFLQADFPCLKNFI
jgi:iron complex outermembrane receptor protein